MTTPQIPRGWRKLRVGEIVLISDRWFKTSVGAFVNHKPKASKTSFSAIGEPYSSRGHCLHIRHIASKRRK